jgi:hypothetical protein
MPSVKFSPVEEQVLELLGEQWHTSAELRRRLWPAHTPEAVNRALKYLRGHELVQLLERGRGEPYYEQTQLGAQVLADHKRSRTALHLEGAHVG